jgi:putative transposase
VEYGRIDELRQTNPIAAMCRVLDVPQGGYHAWRKRPLSPRAQENARLEVEVKAAHERTRQTYSPARLQADMADNGIRAGIHRIERIRKKLGLRCKQMRKSKATTDSMHVLPLAPNLLDGQFAVAAPNKAWVTDITYIATDEGRLYLGGIKDLFNGQLVGYALDARMTQQLVMQALFRAVAAKRPGKGLSHHSDRDSQYCSHAYQNLLRQFGMQVSMRRKGNCWDNAMESCWGSLKAELAITAASVTREQDKREITEYIEIFYNRVRKQARLGHLSPTAFSQQDYAM